MDYSQLDKVRRTTTPLQLDTVEAFARGRISRREFIQRATVVGLADELLAQFALDLPPAVLVVRERAVPAMRSLPKQVQGSEAPRRQP